MASTKKNMVQEKPSEYSFEDSFLWKIKVWLQFTGWLLYLANFVLVLVFLLIALLGAWIGGAPVILVWVPLGLAGILAAKLLFDIVTVRFKIRPAERLPEARNDMDMFDLMRSRVSCRSFQTQKLTPQHLEELLGAVKSHSARAHQLGTAPIRFEYIKAPLVVWPVVGGQEFLVAIAPAEYNRVAVIDIGRSLQKIVIHATKMGLATCWIGPGADQHSIVAHLGDRFDAEKDHVICICAVGYVSRFKPLALYGMQRAQRKRNPLNELFFADGQFSSPLDCDSAPYDKFGRCYEVCQWSPSSYNGQTTRVGAVMDHNKLVGFDFCAINHSKYYAVVALGIWCANWEMGCQALDQKGHLEILPIKDSQEYGDKSRPPCDMRWIVE